jgi:hypothetical protein
MIRRGSRPARSRADVAAIASGRFATNTATRNAMLTVPASRDSEAEDEGLRNAVEDDSEDERAAGWRRPGLRRTTGCEALDENLGPEEQGRPGEKAKCDPSIPGRGFKGLLNELVRDGADQDSRAEGHDQAHVPDGQRDSSSNRTADHERRPALLWVWGRVPPLLERSRARPGRAVPKA